MRQNRTTWLLTTLAVLWLPNAAHALATDPMIEGAKQCTQHLSRFERQYGIPTHLLSAIAATESGRFHDGLKINVPWPWTINAEGKGYHFNSKAEAIAAARKLRARGVQSMDVGCMQVNLHHHPEAFSSLEQAFEPQNNIAYAASFLRALYQDTSSWKEAAGDYHSKTPSLGKKYVGQVYNSWYQIIDKLRVARLQVPSARDMAAMQVDAKPKQVASVTRVSDNKPGKKPVAYTSPKMNSISVSKKESTRENGVLIVRPEIKLVDAPKQAAPTITMAQAKPAVATTHAKVIHVNATGDASVQKTGPRFVFSD